MLAQTAMLYLGATAMVGLLTAFAAHNRKTGWKKPRTALFEAWNKFYVDLGLEVGTSWEKDVHPAPAMRVPTSEEAVDFSAQLLKMRAALGTSNGQSPVTNATDSKARAEQAVLAQQRY